MILAMNRNRRIQQPQRLIRGGSAGALNVLESESDAH